MVQAHFSLKKVLNLPGTVPQLGPRYFPNYHFLKKKKKDGFYTVEDKDGLTPDTTKYQIGDDGQELRYTLTKAL